VNRGIYHGAGGEFGLSTALDDDDLALTGDALRVAMGDLAALAPNLV
jgi:hypothetical protein